MSQMSTIVRGVFKRNDTIRDQGLKTPEDILRYDNIVYGKDAKWQSLDVYRPRKEKDKLLPVIVSVHGGGFVYGDKECYQFYCMDLARRGFAVVNFSYRLAPENRFPANMEDINSVFHWLIANRKTYGFDTGHIFGVGDSAGANLLSLYAAMTVNSGYAAKYDFSLPFDLHFSAIALNCGMYRMIFHQSASHGMTKDLIDDLLPEKKAQEALALLEIGNFITPSFPPTFLMTCQGDFLKEEAPVLAAKLAEKQVPFVYRLYGNERNPLSHVFHCDIRSVEAKLCNDEECSFFREFL